MLGLDLHSPLFRQEQCLELEAKLLSSYPKCLFTSYVVFICCKYSRIQIPHVSVLDKPNKGTMQLDK